jgi:CubicO group peptidase (beta-lactamase class C family)
VEAKHKGRVAEPQKDAQGRRPTMHSVFAPPSWPSGGDGMVSTAVDYARFGQFWLNGGTLDGVRLVSRKTVELMTADHLPPGTRFNAAVTANPSISTPSPAMGQGFGLGFAVRIAQGRNPMHGSLGEYYWAGSTGTNFVIDPREKMVVVLMMQAPDQRLDYRLLMRQLAHQAIVD